MPIGKTAIICIIAVLLVESGCASFKGIFVGGPDLAPNSKRVPKEYKKYKRKNLNVEKGYFQWPYDGVVTSHYGKRWGRFHQGIDIQAEKGTKVKVAAPGEVVYAGDLSGYGELVVVEHKNNLFTAYAHNSRILTKEGKKVKRGQVIAKSGSTGRSTGPHIHFEIRYGKEPVDPLLYLPKR